MRNRQSGQDWDRGGGRGRNQAFPEFEEYEQREDFDRYRGRASYEQESRAGTGGRSGMWEHNPTREPRDNELEDIRNRQREFDRAQSQPRRPGHPSGFERGSYGQYGGQSGMERGGYSQSGMEHRERGGYGQYGGERGDFERGYERDYQSGMERYGQSSGFGLPGMGRGESESRGRGPKGYTRSDERIREDVCDRLSDQPGLDASDVDVTVQSGEVTLSGTVFDRNTKFRIEAIADRVSGVNDVHNQLRIKRESFALRSGEGEATSSSSTGTKGSHH